MSTIKILQNVGQRILAGDTLIALESSEEQRWLKALKHLAEEMNYDLVEWSVTQVEDKTKVIPGIIKFISSIPEQGEKKLFLFKDLHPYLNEPGIIRQLRELVPTLNHRKQAVLFLDPVFTTPLELMKDLSRITLPLPGYAEIAQELQTIVHDLKVNFKLSKSELQRILHAVAGLTLTEASRAIRRSLYGAKKFTEEIITRLVSEKKYMLQGNDLLEFQELKESTEDVGGLEGLKTWIDQRAKAFSAEARSQGIKQPKGVFLFGVQGCGKSLSARVIARQLGFPLIRLDFSNLLQAGRGTSEKNLREVLQLMETISPAVLWMEEIDKGFAGFQKESEGDASMSRMVGMFLTWMQEHEDPVFVVATANNVENLPPELLRRGRFDELFFIDLPNPYERKNIFRIHLEKRQIDMNTLDLELLATKTEGYSGAEIEQIVNSTVIEAYTQNRPITMHDLLEMRDITVPLSVTMEEPIFQLREWARSRCRPATPDSRVMRMMEEENRLGDSLKNDKPVKRKWEEYLENKMYGEALIEYVKFKDLGFFPDLLQNFSTHLPTSGNCELVLDSDHMVTVWQGLSQEFADQIAKYIHNKRLYLHMTDVGEYQKLNSLLRLPVIKALRDAKYPKQVWMPSQLRPMPPADGVGRLGKVAVINHDKSSLPVELKPAPQ